MLIGAFRPLSISVWLIVVAINVLPDLLGGELLPNHALRRLVVLEQSSRGAC